MKFVEVKSCQQKEISNLIFNTVVPRPIAWITTVSTSGIINLAPFSFYNAITTKPPLIFVSIGKRKDGTEKDTAKNIKETGEFVINVVTNAFLDKMIKTGKELPSDKSEIKQFKIETFPSKIVKPPIIKGIPAALECKLKEIIEIGDTPMSVIIGEVVAIHYTDDILQTSTNIIGRLGGKRYTIINNETEQN